MGTQALFSLEEELPAGDLHEHLASFCEFGKRTEIEKRRVGEHEIPVYWNEFWTAKQRACHGLHEISYRACYKPQLPAFFIRLLTQRSETVYDPFMGRGTTLLEARLLGCRAIGNDLNPLSRILIAPRLSPPHPKAVLERLGSIELPDETVTDEELLVFFHPETLREIYGWRAYFLQRQEAGLLDEVDAFLRMVVVNRLTGHSPGFFSVYTLPPNQATSVKAQRRINEKRNQSPPYRDTRTILAKKASSLLSDPLPPEFTPGPSVLLCRSADHTPEIAAESIDLVVTSPPFLNTVDYVTDNWMRNWFCDLQPEAGSLWQTPSRTSWCALMTATFRELRRVLRPGGVIAFEVGEVRKGTIPLENDVVLAAAAAGLLPEAIAINTQHFTKTANCWGVANNAKGTNSNRIVLLRK